MQTKPINWSKYYWGVLLFLVVEILLFGLISMYFS